MYILGSGFWLILAAGINVLSDNYTAMAICFAWAIVLQLANIADAIRESKSCG